MKLLITGTPVSPSSKRAVAPVQGSPAVAAIRGSAYPVVRSEVPFAGLVRTRAFAAVPSTGDVAGAVSPLGGVRPAGMRRPTRNLHIDLDPQSPRSRGGCD